MRLLLSWADRAIPLRSSRASCSNRKSANLFGQPRSHWPRFVGRKVHWKPQRRHAWRRQESELRAWAPYRPFKTLELMGSVTSSSVLGWGWKPLRHSTFYNMKLSVGSTLVPRPPFPFSWFRMCIRSYTYSLIYTVYKYLLLSTMFHTSGTENNAAHMTGKISASVEL